MLTVSPVYRITTWNGYQHDRMADCVATMSEIARLVTSEVALYDMSVDWSFGQSGASHQDECQCRYREREEEEDLEEVRSTRQRFMLVEI